eukprot:355460-Chlamydomonas_euryale.AAC.2
MRDDTATAEQEHGDFASHGIPRRFAPRPRALRPDWAPAPPLTAPRLTATEGLDSGATGPPRLHGS